MSKLTIAVWAGIIFLNLSCSQQKEIYYEAGGKNIATSAKPQPSKEADKTVYYVFENGTYMVSELERKPISKSSQKYPYASNIRYPAAARERGIKGEVIITVIVNELGQMEKAEITKGIGGGCEEEALRVIKEIGQSGYEPAIKAGKPVKVKFGIPVRFNI